MPTSAVVSAVRAESRKATEWTKPYKIIRFVAMDITKPYKFVGFGAVVVTKPH